ncbi:MAG: RagB/SusD family nutrient uptake outer membrane protein [Mangrovimonas sp.]|nr:RagB/SusD family nutrient uptake outer membrane protein [Mangrovimonas sp.]MCB0432935.1 RagB/SusD family nutrient uptake outer membrane protein [Mangrovimonas sp.]MCB0435120.1 RagB/SusD family nutrient uptake outer membrane protein [Mangrovimonas sp.]MCB0470201.1 RagB/SusD family nutrient uptake outer membrane protein [Flavobacteriaceae bacterium]HPF95919.1 RagB/SusD family nutrient uptake outer membrane protein [Mangrovimonas sp.]
MKNLKVLITWSTVAVLLLTACSDQLNEQEGFTLASDIDYTDSAAMIDPMVGSYQTVYTRGWEDFPLISVRGDDVNAGGLGDQQDYMETDFFNYNKDYWMYNSVWQNFSRDMIDVNANINEILKFKEYATGNYLDLADQYVAESKVLRGWLQFQMTRIWGSVFIIQTNTPAEDIASGVKTKAETMQYISDLMDEAIPNLPAIRPNERTDIPGGVTKYTALAIKALANLEIENYQAVAEACGEIINSNKFTLDSDFYELFKIPGKLSNENLFELQYSDYGTPAGSPANNYLWAFFGPQGWTPAVSGAGAGWGFYEPSLKYIKFMLDRGETTRLQTSVLFTDRGIDEITNDPNYSSLPSWISNTTPDGDVINDYSRAMFASGKHYLPSNQLTAGRTEYGSNKNMIVIRYAEVLLMYAEALTRGASSSGMSADQAVNLVRARANMPNISGVTTAQVMNEKFAELAMEWGIRYYDIIRTGQYGELSYDGHNFSESKAYLPYPQAQVDAIPELTDTTN